MKIYPNCLHCGSANIWRGPYCSRTCYFWGHVDGNVSGKCWLWTGGYFPSGYGFITVHGHVLRAHRFSFELHHGIIPPGAMVLHACDNKLCVNPAHLHLGDHDLNMQEAHERKRFKRGELAVISKLTSVMVAEIRNEHKAGSTSQAELARKFGVTPTAVRSVMRRKTWKHLA